MYRINADLAKHRLEVDFIDGYADIDHAALSRDLRAGALRVKAGGRHFYMLVDFTRISVMPQNTTEGARGEIEWCIANGLRRSANVVNSTIAKMQLQRLQGDDRFQQFTSRAEAIAWLESGD